MQQPLFVVKVWRTGTSLVFPLYKAALELLGWREGSLLIVRVYPPYLILRVADPASVLSLKEIPHDAFPPAWPSTVELPKKREE
jgi:hypothetical protein